MQLQLEKIEKFRIKKRKYLINSFLKIKIYQIKRGIEAIIPVDLTPKLIAIESEAKYLKEGLEVIIFFYENELLGIELPEKIDYVITETEPAVKGNTATNATKDATLENGLTVRVPLFIEQGEEIIVSTKDGKYVSRK